MHTTVTFPLIASCISIISMAIVLTITWVTRSSRPRQRISITLLSIGVIGFCAARLLGVQGANASMVLGAYLGFSVSALVVALMLPRRSV
jgi:hypothetical protein